MKRGVSRILILMSAFLVALAFWFDDFAALILVALVPLFVVLFQEESSIQASKTSLLFSSVLFLLLTSWLTSLYPMEFMGFDRTTGLFIYLGWIAFAFLLAIPLFGVLLIISSYRIAGLRRCLIVASLWTLMEWVMELGSMGFPWFRLSLPLANLPLLVQAASVVGSLGLTFFVVFVNASLAEYLILRRFEPKIARKTSTIAGLIVLAVLAYGIDQTQGQDNDETKEVNVLSLQDDSLDIAILQGNITSEDKWEVGSEWKHFDWHRNMTLHAIKQGAKLIVWPETALPISMNEYPGMLNELQRLASEHEVMIIVGSFYEVEDKSMKAIFPTYQANTVSIQESDNSAEPKQALTLDRGLYNGLYMFPNDQLYLKQHLVPIGEYMPQWMLSALPLLQNFQLANQLTPASQSILLEGGDWRIGSLICFESIFPDLSRRHVLDGANVLLIASNDAWYQGSSEIIQHKNHAILRAVESNRYVIRGANTGISAVIDPRGKVLGSLSEDESGILQAKISRIDERSIYHQMPYLTVFASLLILLFNIRGFASIRLKEFGRWIKYRWIR